MVIDIGLLINICSLIYGIGFCKKVDGVFVFDGFGYVDS